MTNPAEPALVITRSGPVTTFLLNRPARLNALTEEMHHLLDAALNEFAADDTQRVGVISGAGRGFCAGSDLVELAARRRQGSGRITLPPGGYAGLIERFDLDKPLIAAVNGVAAGGGFEIALACDLIIASNQARFGLPEALSGQVAVGGGPHRLARQIPMKQAMALVLSGDLVSAEQGLALGFVNEVAPEGKLEEVTARWVKRILRNGPLALRATKQIMTRGLDASSLADAIAQQSGMPAMERWRGSSEAVEGATAFAEKRAPEWMTS